MSFYREKKANPTVDCSDDEILVEQSHCEECDINNIIRKHGVDLIAATAPLLTPDMFMDASRSNDFREALEITRRAESSFLQLPAQIRARFDNSPAAFLDFVHDPANRDEMVSMGLAVAPPPPPIKQPPTEVIIVSGETPSAK